MGIPHSTTRFLTFKQRDDEEGGESSIHQDCVERPPRISIGKAVKGLLRRVVSIILSLAKPRKAADPLLPVRDPAPTSLTQPLILQNPPISAPPTAFDGEESEWSDEENHSADRENQINHHAVVSVHEFTSDEMWAAVFTEQYASNNCPFLEEVSSSSSSSEEEEVEIKSVIVVCDEKWIKHYSSRHRILLVGEGDFSFSACLAVKFLWAPNIIATSLDSQAFLEKNYCNSSRNIEKLRSRGSMVMHGINVSTMANHQHLRHLKFDRIIFNFPYAGLNVVKHMPRQSQLRQHQRLVGAFLENAREMVGENGEIHITHKTNGFHAEWGVVALGRGRGLRLIEAVKFNHRDYPGYNSKCGFGGDNFFNCNPSKTYKFGLHSEPLCK